MTKKMKYRDHVISYLKKESLKIKELASVVGTLTATFPRNRLGLLYYRALDKCKTYALKKSMGNFEYRVTLSKDALLDGGEITKYLYQRAYSTLQSLSSYTLMPQMLIGGRHVRVCQQGCPGF